MALFHQKKTEGNYEDRKKNLLLLLLVLVFAVFFLTFLAVSALKGSVTAKDLVSTGGGQREEEALAKEGAYELTFAPLLNDDSSPVCDNEGHPLTVDEEGNVFYEDENGDRLLVGWEGQPITDEEGRRLSVDRYGNYYALDESGRRALRDEYGRPRCAEDGKTLYVDSYGNPYVLDDDGAKVLTGASGEKVVDTNGNRVLLTGSAQDAVYAASGALREKKDLAADKVHETLYGASARAGEAFRGHIRTAALRTRETLRNAAKATGAFVRDSYEGIKDSPGEVLQGAGELAQDASDGAKGIANSWYSFLRNDWEKLKKDIATPASEFSDGNIPNPEENEIYTLFP